MNKPLRIGMGGWLGMIALAVLPMGAPQRAGAAAADTAVEHTEMLAKVFPAIVRIEAIRLQPLDGRLTKAWIGGSGVIISAAGYVLTNCHVAEDGDYFRCYLYDGEEIEAHRIGQDAMTDLAVLQLDLTQRAKKAPPLPVAVFGDSDRMVAGNAVFALGSPGFLSQSSTRGIVSNPSMVLPEQTAGKMILRGEDVGMLVRWILHDATIFGGNSGGPLVNAQGEVVGINEIGVFSLSGAIPANLARGIADQLIKQGHVTRGWSGITVQERLEADGQGPGVVVSDIAPGSPAAGSGILPGDIVLSADGHAIEGEKEKAVASYYRLETGRLPGNDFTVDFERKGQRQSVKIKLDQRQLAQSDDVELHAWGAVVRDLTRDVARDARLPSESGVWLENIRPGGPSGQAEPDLRRTDVLTAVDNQPVGDVAALQALTNKLIPDGAAGTRTVLVTFRRDGGIMNSVVELRLTDPRPHTPTALKAWLGVASQPLTPKLATQLGIKSDSGGARLTRIYPGTKAEAAGLRVGDVVLSLDGADVAERRQEDADRLSQMVRQYRAGAEATFAVWRDGQKISLPVTLELQPTPAADLAYWADDKLEYEVREVAFDDRIRLQLPPSATGVMVDKVAPAGWAYLADLEANDLVVQVAGTPVANLVDFRRARDAAAGSGADWLVLLVQRRGETLFVEISLKPLKP